MDFVQRLTLYICVVALICLFIGLVKPWVVLWWEHTQNRRKAIRLYGSIAAISYLTYWILDFTQ